VDASAAVSRASWTMFKGSSNVQTFNAFNSSIPLHFDMLNATPYSLCKEGNVFVVRK
jgi:hypothetical protein